MSAIDTAGLLEALLRLEQQRQPLTDRATLLPLLAQVATEIRAVTRAARVTLDVAADAFEPPLEILVEVGAAPVEPSPPTSRQALQWGGVHLATVEIVPFDRAASEQVALLLRVAIEGIAEVWAAERLVYETQMRTRHQLAGELHDAGKQVLPAIRLFAERAEREVQRDPQTAAALLRDIRDVAQQGLDDMAFWLGELRGQNVAGDLGMALERLLGQVAQALPDLRIEQQIVLPVMPRRVAACVFGMVRNGLSNVLQHAQAHTVSVHIGPAQGGVLVRVRDDGVGVQPRDALAAPGIGLESILERAQALGGRSILDGAPGHGVSLEIWLPLPDEEEPYG